MKSMIQEMRDAGLSNKQIVEELACCAMFVVMVVVHGFECNRVTRGSRYFVRRFIGDHASSRHKADTAGQSPSGDLVRLRPVRTLHTSFSCLSLVVSCAVGNRTRKNHTISNSTLFCQYSDLNLADLISFLAPVLPRKTTKARSNNNNFFHKMIIIIKKSNLGNKTMVWIDLNYIKTIQNYIFCKENQLNKKYSLCNILVIGKIKIIYKKCCGVV